MGESQQRRAAPASSKQGTKIPSCSPNYFAIAARAFWPRKTAAELAFRAKVTERAAKFWLSGKREPSHDILMVMLEQMRPRRRD